MNHSKLYNTRGDREWLTQVHLPDVRQFEFGSFTLKGNEDWPSEIRLYTSENPLVTERPVAEYRDTESGGYRVVWNWEK